MTSQTISEATRLFPLGEGESRRSVTDRDLLHQLRRQLNSVLLGKEEVVEHLLAAF